jgi:GWxTD domain-containing protein
MRRSAVAYVAILSVTACGQWQRVGSTDQPQPGTTLPRLFDAATTYRSMGLLVGRGTMPFIADVRYLAGPRPDSVVGVIVVSLTNQGLDFQRDGAEFVADYRVEATFTPDSGTPISAAREERVRVRSFQETLRADESVIFQQFVRLPSQRYSVNLVVRDTKGPHVGRAERVDTVPRFAASALARPIAYYEGPGRTSRDSLPKLIANPKSTLPYGGDTLRFYVEAYGLPAGTTLAAQVVDQGGTVLWRDTVRSTGGALATARFGFPPTLLSVGHGAFEVSAASAGGPPLTSRAPVLVSFSGQWVITNLDDMVYLLRFFENQDQVDKLRKAAPAARDSVWREFWRVTDPTPITPQNEALDEYFRRLQMANQKFRDEAEQGWLTDRGEVFITLGDPDDVLDMSSGMDRTGVRTIRWTYTDLRLTLFFLDQGFGRFQLTPTSRAEYQRVLARVRRSQ